MSKYGDPVDPFGDRISIVQDPPGQMAKPFDVEALIAEVLALEPPPVRDDTLRGWHDALAEAAHLIRARLVSMESDA